MRLIDADFEIEFGVLRGWQSCSRSETDCSLCNTDNGESFYCAHGKKRENVTDGFVKRTVMRNGEVRSCA